MKHLLSVYFLLIVLVSPGFAQDTVHVTAGWNLIGSVKAGAVPVVLTTVPEDILTSSFFGYAPGVGYQSTYTLSKGIGYWVKVNSDGVIIFDTAPAPDECTSKALIYGGKIYHTVKVGEQCWMLENMDVGTMVAGDSAQTDNGTIEKYCYDNDPVYCALYGGLYQWDEAMQFVTTEGAQGICPAGWHIPSLSDFESLSSAVGDDGNALKTVGQGTGEGAGTNTSGFSVLYAGLRDGYGGYFNYLGTSVLFWSSTDVGGANARELFLYPGNSTIGLGESYEANGFSVRCLAD